MKYVAITCGRNEEKWIQQTITGVLSQSLPPEAFIIVDDGSTDQTEEILDNNPRVTKVKLDNPRHPTRGVNLAWARQTALKKATELVPDWDYLLNVDADSTIPPDYVKDLAKKFQKNPRLGIASGMPKGIKIWRGRASDGAKLIRRETMNDIRQFTPMHAFDTLALLQAKQHGWQVESFGDITYSEMRTAKRNKISRWILSGRARYYLGFPWWHTFLIAIVYAPHKPIIIGSFSMFLAHLLTSIGSPHRPFSKEYYHFANKYAMWETLERYHERRLK